MGETRVSVLMTVRNGERYVEQAVASVLGQTLADMELIVVDDGSTDRTGALLDRFAGLDRRVKVFYQRARGIPQAANFGLGYCRAGLIARLDADDVAKRDRLETQVRFIETNGVDCVGSSFELIDEKGRYLTTLRPPMAHEEIERASLAGHGAICHSSAMFTRRIIEKVGGYDQTYAMAEDLDLWLRMGEVGKLANIERALVQYRLHGGSVSEKRCDQERAFARQACQAAWKRRGITGRFEAGERWRPGRGRVSRGAFLRRYGWWAIKSGERRTAAIYGWKAVMNQPGNSEAWQLLLAAARGRRQAREAGRDGGV